MFVSVVQLRWPRTLVVNWRLDLASDTGSNPACRNNTQGHITGSRAACGWHCVQVLFMMDLFERQCRIRDAFLLHKARLF